MLDHVGLNVSDLERSKDFYTETLAPLGYRLAKEMGPAIGFGIPQGYGKSANPAGEFWIVQGAPLAERFHIAFSAASREIVDAFFQSAVAAGGTSNGAPGLRPHYHANYYAAFILDPDGYNIEAVCHAAV